MAIDIQREQIFPFKELAARKLKIFGKTPASVAKIHRWRNGLEYGVKLEAVKVDGVWGTSIQAFQRFSKAVTVVNALKALAPARRPPAKWQRARR